MQSTCKAVQCKVTGEHEYMFKVSWAREREGRKVEKLRKDHNVMDRLPCNLDYTKPHILYESMGRQTEQREAIHSAELPGGESSKDRSWRLRKGKQDMCGGTDYFGMSWSRDEIWSVFGNGIEFFLLTGRWDQSSISKREITEGNNIFTVRHSRRWWLLRYQRLLLALDPHVTRTFSAVKLCQTSLGL